MAVASVSPLARSIASTGVSSLGRIGAAAYVFADDQNLIRARLQIRLKRQGLNRFPVVVRYDFAAIDQQPIFIVAGHDGDSFDRNGGQRELTTKRSDLASGRFG